MSVLGLLDMVADQPAMPDAACKLQRRTIGTRPATRLVGKAVDDAVEIVYVPEALGFA